MLGLWIREAIGLTDRGPESTESLAKVVRDLLLESQGASATPSDKLEIISELLASEISDAASRELPVTRSNAERIREQVETILRSPSFVQSPDAPESKPVAATPSTDRSDIIATTRDVLRTSSPRVEVRSAMSLALATQEQWFDRIVRRTAASFEADPEELRQETIVAILRSSAELPEDDVGLRVWLRRRLEWTANNLRRARAREVNYMPRENASASSEDTASRIEDSEEILGERLVELGLTPTQARTVAGRISGLNSRELSQLQGRTQASVARDARVGLRRLESLFGLTADEAEIIRTFRRLGSMPETAATLGLPLSDARETLDSAHKKIDWTFNNRS